MDNSSIWTEEHRNQVSDFGTLVKCSKELFGPTTYLEPFESDIEPVTFNQLYDFIKNFDNYLLPLNIEEEEKIAVLLPNSSLMVLLFFSIIATKRIFVPINPKSTPNEIDYILNDSQAVLFFTDTNQKKKVEQLQYSVETIIIQKYSDFINDILSQNSSNINDKKQNDGNLGAEIIYTSGTTGEPKGVLLTHNNFLEDSFCLGKMFGFNASNKFLTVSPLFHNSGQIITTLVPLWSGGQTTAVRSDMGMVKFWYFVDRFDIDWSLGMPAHVNFILENNIKPKKNTLKGFFCGGAKLDSRKQTEFEERFSVPIFNNYGLTETTSIAVCDNPTSNDRVVGSVGQVIPINEIKIYKENKEVQPMEIGEIRIKGPNVFKEYINKPRITNKTLKDGWLATGDLGYHDENGFIFIKDRVDNMILVGGENVYAADVENIIPKLKGMKEAVLSSIPDSILGNKLVLVYKQETNTNVDIDVWKKTFAENLSSFKIPKRFINIKELGREDIPKAPNGKMLRKNVKDLIKFKLSNN